METESAQLPTTANELANPEAGPRTRGVLRSNRAAAIGCFVLSHCSWVLCVLLFAFGISRTCGLEPDEPERVQSAMALERYAFAILPFIGILGSVLFIDSDFTTTNNRKWGWVAFGLNMFFASSTWLAIIAMLALDDSFLFVGFL